MWPTVRFAHRRYCWSCSAGNISPHPNFWFWLKTLSDVCCTGKFVDISNVGSEEGINGSTMVIPLVVLWHSNTTEKCSENNEEKKKYINCSSALSRIECFVVNSSPIFWPLYHSNWCDTINISRPLHAKRTLYFSAGNRNSPATKHSCKAWSRPQYLAY